MQDTIDFNGRVIIDMHGDNDGNLYLQFGEKSIPSQSDADDAPQVLVGSANSVASKLRLFFDTYRISVQRIDLVICGDTGAGLIELFKSGYLTAGGPTDIEIIGFEGKVGENIGIQKSDDRFFSLTGNDGETFIMPLSDYYLKGYLFSDSSAQRLITKARIGKPEPVTVPEPPQPKTCSIQ